MHLIKTCLSAHLLGGVYSWMHLFPNLAVNSSLYPCSKPTFFSSAHQPKFPSGSARLEVELGIRVGQCGGERQCWAFPCSLRKGRQPSLLRIPSFPQSLSVPSHDLFDTSSLKPSAVTVEWPYRRGRNRPSSGWITKNKTAEKKLSFLVFHCLQKWPARLNVGINSWPRIKKNGHISLLPVQCKK